MKTWLRSYRLALAGLALGSLVLANGAAAQTVLTFNRWTPATHHFHARIMQPWAERVEEATEGRVRIRFTPSSLGSPARQFDLARTGVADITAANQAYTPELFPLALFAELPFLSTSAEALSVANWRVTQALRQQVDEYRDVQLLGIFSNGPAMVFTRNTVVDGMADLKGLRARVSEGMPARIVQSVEGVPVSAPITEGYQMLSKGIIEAMLLPPDSIHSFKMDQYLGHMTTFPRGLYSSTFFLVMNRAKWNALSPRDQEAILRVSGEAFAREAGRVWDDQDRLAIASFQERGMKVHAADPAFDAAIAERLSGLEAGWVATAKARGVDGEAVMRQVREELAALQAGAGGKP